MWYIMDEFGSKVQHSDKPSCGMAPFFYIQNQLAYTLLWPLQDLQKGGNCLAAHATHIHDFICNSHPLNVKGL